MKSMKNMIKKIIPVSIEVFKNTLEKFYRGLNADIDAKNESIFKNIEGLNMDLQKQQEQIKELHSLISNCRTQNSTILSFLECLSEDVNTQLSESASRLAEIQNKFTEIEVMRQQILHEFCAQKDREIRTMKLPILSFEVHLAEHCNLNCKGCDHFCPVAEPKLTDLSVFERDFQRLSELFHGEAREIHLLGGEPLLNPEIESYCKIARQYFPMATIDIVTNGLLLSKMPDSFWMCCHDYAITVRPTKYPISVDYECAEQKARQFDVEYVYFNDAKQIKTMTHNRYDLKGLQDPRQSFIECPRANRCIYLADGKLYPCTFAPNIHHFNKYFGENLPISERDYIDIFEASSADEILEFLSHPIPFCRFCNILGAELEQPWEISKKQIEEWI